MAQVLVRALDDSVVEAVRRRAQRKHHSLEQELRFIIGEAVQCDRTAALHYAEGLCQRLRVQQSDSTDLIREDRDR